MASTRPFRSEHVIHEQICQPALRGYHVGFDQKEFRLKPLVDVIRSVIPEFAFGYHEGNTVPMTDIVDRLKEAAATVYDTDKYQKRGEFGELILHLLLRDFHATIPLVSTMYFKDAINVAAHGFDGIHVSTDGNEHKLWLGESKLYGTGAAGIRELLSDMKKHVQADYMRQQFTLISRKIPQDATQIAYWRQVLDSNQPLDTIFKRIVIPMVCTYSSSLFTDHTDNTPEYFAAFEAECHALHQQFQTGRIPCDVEFILLLLPIPDKDVLTRELDQRLKAMQRI